MNLLSKVRGQECRQQINEIANPSCNEQNAEPLVEHSRFIGKVPKRNKPKTEEYLRDECAVVLCVEQEKHYGVRPLNTEGRSIRAISGHTQGLKLEDSI